MIKQQITIVALVEASPVTVWQYWTQPAHITQWNFANDDWCCPRAENELKVGGRYAARMEAKDGSVGFEFEAVYDKILPHEEVALTMDDGRKVTTHFQSQEGGTKVTTTFDAENENSLELQREGWQAILNNFKAYAEGAMPP